MQVLIAKHAGFCEGVERAFRLAVEKAKSGQHVFMLGNLVHNKQVVEKLKSSGVTSVAALSEIPAGTKGSLLISAHGVSPEIYDQAKKLSLEIIDTTCPWVKKAQRIAKELADEGRIVFIVGDKGHAEVNGLVGWSQGKAIVVEKIDDIDKLSFSPNQKAGVIAQTTQPKEHFSNMVSSIAKKIKDLKAIDTICDATAKRQSATVDIAKKVDLMLVIGDKMSANSKRLAELCVQAGVTTYQIETTAELKPEWLVGKEKIGITAGASTPEWVIQEVLGVL